jgi:hypothetical protein
MLQNSYIYEYFPSALHIIMLRNQNIVFQRRASLINNDKRCANNIENHIELAYTTRWLSMYQEVWLINDRETPQCLEISQHGFRTVNLGVEFIPNNHTL